MRLPDIWKPGPGHWLTGKADTSQGLAREVGALPGAEGRRGLGLEP